MRPGWMMPCFDVTDLAASCAFYEGMGFRKVGGIPDQGWAILANGPMELGLFHGHFQGWMLNFRGDNVPELAEHFQELGLNIVQQRKYSMDEVLEDWKSVSDGQAYLLAECGECTVVDPEGRMLFFDTYPSERVRFKHGALYAVPGYEAGYADGQPVLGHWEIELASPDPAALAQFYAHLGLIRARLSDGTYRMSAPGQDWSLHIVAGGPDATFIACSGSAPGTDEHDPDGYRFAIRP